MSKAYTWIPTTSATSALHPSHRWLVEATASRAGYELKVLGKNKNDPESGSYAYDTKLEVSGQKLYFSTMRKVSGSASCLQEAEELAEGISLIFMKSFDALIENEKKKAEEAEARKTRAAEAVGGLSVAEPSSAGSLSLIQRIFSAREEY